MQVRVPSVESPTLREFPKPRPAPLTASGRLATAMATPTPLRHNRP